MGFLEIYSGKYVSSLMELRRFIRDCVIKAAVLVLAKIMTYFS